MSSSYRRARRAPSGFSLTSWACVALLAGCADTPGAPVPGSIVVRVEGLPSGVAAPLSLSGSTGAPRALVATSAAAATAGGLKPGDYALAAEPVAATDGVYAPDAVRATLQVRSGDATPALVRYALATGSLLITTSGLPVGVVPRFDVSINGSTYTIAAGDTLRGLAPGRYDVAARVTVLADADWVATPAAQPVDVRAGSLPSVMTVRFHPRMPLDLAVEGVTVTQSVQRADGAVPLVTGKPALLRVFVRASEENAAAPRVRVRAYVSGALVATQILEPAGATVPTARVDSSLAATWNATLPADVVRPGLALAVDVDPDGRIAEADESNNAWPADGTAPVDVRALPAAVLRLVPVTVAGATGAVDGANATRYVDFAARSLPLGALDVAVHAPFASSAPVLQNTDGNGAWQQVLREIAALRVIEGSDATYFAVVHPTYANGMAGLSLIGQPVAMGWDAFPNASQVLAHELGHTFGRLHAPCGGVVDADPAYAEPNGATGAWGYDAANGRLRAPSTPDLMGYCSDPWVSAYTWNGVLQFREATTRAATMALVDDAPRRCLVVWGHVTTAGVVQLEPAFEVTTRPSLPARAGARRVRALDAEGAELLALSFDAAAVSDAVGERAFAFAVPLDDDAAARIASLRADGPARERTIVARTTRGDTTARAERESVDRARLRWDAATYPAALVRDAATGQVLGIVRGGDATVAARGAVELTLSDGVRSRTVRVP